MNRGSMMVGRATPRLVHGCTIRNESNMQVYVRVLYEPIQGHGEQIHERRVEFQLNKGGQIHIDEEEYDKGSFTIRQTIDAIEVTRPNGQIQKITAPFDGVNAIELNWLFVIDNRNVRSANRHN